MAGRPRNPGLEQRLLSAAWTLLTESGYAALTLTQVATLAGAHRSDVYRRWPNKVRLVADTLDAHLPPVTQVDTGSLQTDMRVYVDDLARSWSAPWIDSAVGWLADLQHDPDAELAFRSTGLRRGRQLRDALERAVERGEIDSLPDLHLLGGLLEGPLMHSRLVNRRPLTPEFLDAVALSAYHLVLSSTTKR